MRSRSIVAMTAAIRTVDGTPRVRLNAAYTRALEHVGLVPIIVPPLSTPARALALLDMVGGLVLTGGEDVNPAHYGAAPHATVEHVSDARDATELALVHAARERALPTLAICRGVQLLNVALGGTLVQDIPAAHPDALDHAPGAPRDCRTHTVAVRPGSRLAQLLGAESLHVNSSHHQALDRVAQSLSPVAHAPDGIIEGVESTDAHWWAVGVQWHPEELVGAAEDWDRRLFEGFAGRVRGA